MQRLIQQDQNSPKFMQIKNTLLTGLFGLFIPLASLAQSPVTLSLDTLQTSYELGEVDSFHATVVNSSQDSVYQNAALYFKNENGSNVKRLSDTLDPFIFPGDTLNPEVNLSVTPPQFNIGTNNIEIWAETVTGRSISDSLETTINVKDTVANPIAINTEPVDSFGPNNPDSIPFGYSDTFSVEFENVSNRPIDTHVSVFYQVNASFQKGAIIDSHQLSLQPQSSTQEDGEFIANSAYVPGGPSAVAIWPEFTNPGDIAGDTVFYNIYVQDTSSGIPESLRAQKNAIKLFPNPVKTEVRLATKQHKNIERVSIVSLKGEKLETYQDPKQKLNLAGFPAGSYLMNIRFEDNTRLTKKLIINP